MSETKNNSQRLRTERHKLAHPESEARRKAKQDQKDAILRFHVRRHKLCGIKIPNNVDQESDAFKRAVKAYNAELASPVEVEEVAK